MVTVPFKKIVALFAVVIVLITTMRAGVSSAQFFPDPEPNLSVVFSFAGEAVSEGGEHDFAGLGAGEAEYTWSPATGTFDSEFYAELYRGVLGTAELVSSRPLSHAEFVSGEATSTLAFAAESDYFAVVYEILFFPCEGGDFCLFTTHDDTVRWFEEGLGGWFTAGSPPDSWGIVSFSVSEAGGPPPPPPTPAGFSSVAFIPGLQASRLYVREANGSENRLWEPDEAADIRALFLDDSGASVRAGIYTRDIIDESNVLPLTPPPIFGFNIYKTFMSFMDGLVSDSVIASWRALPYDWRLDLFSVVTEDIALAPLAPAGSGEKYRMTEAVEELAAGSDTGKVTLVAHSNGGLVAKFLLDELARQGKAGLVDKLILVAVPQIGTPQAAASLLHGDGQEMPRGLGFIVSREDARELGENMRSGHTLLPSAGYFARVLDPVIEFDPDAPLLAPFRALYGFVVNTVVELRSFLTGDGGARSEPASADTDTPNVLDADIMTDTAGRQAILDAWEPPAGVEVFEIAGWGLETLRGIRYTERPTRYCTANLSFCGTVAVLDREPLWTSDGDGTVVTPSAAVGEGAYFVNLSSFNSKLFNIFSNRKHPDILEATPTKNLIEKIIKNDVSVLPNHVVTIQPTGKNTLRLRVLSPVSLDVYDSDGNHTGRATTTGTDLTLVEERIPNSTYQEFGEGKYLTLDGADTYRVFLEGTGEGTFTLEIDEVENGSTTESVVYPDLPVTPSLLGEMSVSTTTLSALALDADGDGAPEVAISPSSPDDPLAYVALIRSRADALARSRSVERFLDIRLDRIAKFLARERPRSDRLAAEVAEDTAETLEEWGKKKKAKVIAPGDAAVLIPLFENLAEMIQSKDTDNRDRHDHDDDRDDDKDDD